jgi:hypothetical protein
MLEDTPLSFPEATDAGVEHEMQDMKQAYHNALYGNGLSVVELPDDVSASVGELLAFISTTSPSHVEDSYERRIMSFFWQFDRDLVEPILSAIMSPLNELTDEPYIAANMQINAYHPGSALGMHYDSGSQLGVFEPSTHEDSLEFVYVLMGEKDLIARPHTAGEEPSGAVKIHQKPGMLIILRGSAFEFEGKVYPSVEHGVPTTTEDSAILTFDIMRVSQAASDETN